MNINIFTVIGFLNNYTGAYSSGDHIVQVLPAHETGRADSFVKIAGDALEEARLEPDIVREDSPQNIVVRSTYLEAEIGRLLASCKKQYLGRDYFVLTDDIFTPIRSPKPNDEGLLQRIAFLRGAYLGAGTKNELIIYNDSNKAILLYSILCTLAGEDDEIDLRSRFLAPQTSRLSVNYEGDIWKKILKKLQ